MSRPQYNEYQPAVIRINAGSLDGAAFTDTADNTWSKDYNFVGGNADKSDDSISAAADGAQRVYGTCRTGQSFQYGFTKADGLMPGGTYILELHFAETYYEAAGARVFSVVVNGEEKIAGLDIFSRAGGKDVALVLHVPVTLGSDGVLSLVFFGTTDQATVAGAPQFFWRIEVLVPALMRINAGAVNDYTDSDGAVWAADHSFVGDGREATMEAITAPEDWRPIYQDNHLAPEFSYVFYPADGLTPSAGHTVVLDFIELDATAAGTRLFDVQINGQLVLQSFDVFAAAGGQHFVPVRRHFDVVLGSGGVLIITFTGVQRSATVAGIEIYPALPVAGGLPSLAPAAAPTGEAPISAPVLAPASAPVTAAELALATAPVQAPISEPVTAPAAGPTRAPVAAPIQAPAAAQVLAPSPELFIESSEFFFQDQPPAPTQAPSEGPVHASALAPDQAQVTKPVTAPTEAPIQAPATKPVTAPQSVPIQAPMPAPVPQPSVAPTALPSEQKTAAPFILQPTAAPALPPIMGDDSAPVQAPARQPSSALPPLKAVASQPNGAPAPAPLLAAQLKPVRVVTLDPSDISAPASAPEPLMWPLSVPVPAPQPLPAGGPDPEGWTLEDEDYAFLVPWVFEREVAFGDPCQELQDLQNARRQYMRRIGLLNDILDDMVPPGTGADPQTPAPVPAPDGLPQVIPPAEPPIINPPQGTGDKAPATAPSGLEAPAPGPSGPQDDGGSQCPHFPVPAYSGPEITSLGIVRVELRYDEPFDAPECAPSCLMRLGCGEASFDPAEEGWPISRGVVFEPSDDRRTYTTFFYFPFAATHFNQQNQLQQMELVMDDQLDACIDYISNPCDMTSATRLADVTYDSVHPTCSITKVSERFGEPDNNTKIRRRLMEATGSQQLYILMLFNFSKPMASFGADDVIVRGGAVSEVLTVPNTNTTQYFVWVAVISGTGSFSIAIRPGKPP